MELDPKLNNNEDLTTTTTTTTTTTNIESELLDILCNNVNWQRFHELGLSIGKELNASQWRFLKAVILENGIAHYSNDKLTYVGDSKNGCDFIVKKSNTRIEMKYVEGGIFSGKNLSTKKTTSEIKLMNSNGTNTHSVLPDTYSDYLLIADLNGAGLISKEQLQKYIISEGDGIKAKIPIDALHIIFKPSDIKKTTKKELHIKETFMNTINQIITSV